MTPSPFDGPPGYGQPSPARHCEITGFALGPPHAAPLAVALAALRALAAIPDGTPSDMVRVYAAAAHHRATGRAP